MYIMPGWAFVLAIVILVVGSCILVGIIASRKLRLAEGWCWLSVFLTIAAWSIVAIVVFGPPDKPTALISVMQWNSALLDQDGKAVYVAPTSAAFWRLGSRYQTGVHFVDCWAHKTQVLLDGQGRKALGYVSKDGKVYSPATMTVTVFWGGSPETSLPVIQVAMKENLLPDSWIRLRINNVATRVLQGDFTRKIERESYRARLRDALALPHGATVEVSFADVATVTEE